MQAKVESIAHHLKGELPTLASQLIEKHADMSHPLNQSFAQNPNDPAEHAPSWHQFGIVEHSERFHESMNTSVLEYVDEWGLREPVEAVLSTEIDGISKQDLLSLTALLHDVGKFTGRKIETKEDGSLDIDFKDHEAASGRVIREDPVNEYLTSHGLTADQIEYIARTAELHFELGKLRRVAKNTDAGYTMKFAETPEFQAAIEGIIDEHPDFAVEIGLQFIADAMSKSEAFSEAADDIGIEMDRYTFEEMLAVKGLNRKLISQVLQVPVNLKVAKTYLETWAKKRATI